MKWLEWRELPVENTSTQRTLSTQRNLFGIYTKTLMTHSIWRECESGMSLRRHVDVCHSHGHAQHFVAKTYQKRTKKADYLNIQNGI